MEVDAGSGNEEEEESELSEGKRYKSFLDVTSNQNKHLLPLISTDHPQQVSRNVGLRVFNGRIRDHNRRRKMGIDQNNEKPLIGTRNTAKEGTRHFNRDRIDHFFNSPVN